MKKIIIISIIALVFPIIALAFFQPATLTDGVSRIAVYTQEQANNLFSKGYELEQKAGAVVSLATRQFFGNGITTGGYYATSSTATTYTLTDTELKKPTIAWNAGQNITISIGSSTGAFLKNTGDTAKFLFYSATSTEAATITFAAKGGWTDLQMTEATGGDLILNGEDWAEITFIRMPSAKIAVIFNEFTEAD